MSLALFLAGSLVGFCVAGSVLAAMAADTRAKIEKAKREGRW